LVTNSPSSYIDDTTLGMLKLEHEIEEVVGGESLSISSTISFRFANLIVSETWKSVLSKR
jgi:hypothetical protein